MSATRKSGKSGGREKRGNERRSSGNNPTLKGWNGIPTRRDLALCIGPLRSRQQRDGRVAPHVAAQWLHCCVGRDNRSSWSSCAPGAIIPRWSNVVLLLGKRPPCDENFESVRHCQLLAPRTMGCASISKESESHAPLSAYCEMILLHCSDVGEDHAPLCPLKGRRHREDASVAEAYDRRNVVDRVLNG